MRLVCEQREHDEISIGAIEAMASIWVVVRLQLQISNVIHHLVLAFDWYAGV